MQKLCDKIRISNAIGAISNGDMEYIKELSFFEILKKYGLNAVVFLNIHFSHSIINSITILRPSCRLSTITVISTKRILKTTRSFPT